jgi:monoamine oxidase
MSMNDKKSISRRDFLNGMVISAASLAAMSRLGTRAFAQALPMLDKTDDFSRCHKIWRGEAFAFPEAGEHRYDCIIIGGGMSGLVAAWKLLKLGIKDILIIDKDDTMGGLCRADTIGGITAARASAYASFPFDADMTELYRDLGFVTKVTNAGKIEIAPQFLLQPPYDQMFVNGAWVRDAFEDAGIDALPVAPYVRDEFHELVDTLDELWEWQDDDERAAFDCPPDEASREKRKLDDMTLAEYAASQEWSVEMVKLFDPLLKSAYGVGHDRISAWAALDILSDELLPADPGESSLGFPGGNALFVEKLAQWIGAERLLPKTLVTQVRQSKQEAQVGVMQGGKAQTLRARTVIFAAPQFMSPYLLPDLPEDRRNAVKTFEYAAYVVANVAVSRTPPDLAYSNQLIGDFVMSDFIVADWAGQADPRHAPLDRPNVLTAYCPLTAHDRWQLLSSSLDDWQAGIIGEFEKCLPNFGQTVTGFYLYRWGHAFAVPVKGAVFAAARKLVKQPLDRIFFAHADVEGIPTIDHAMASGFRSAEEVSEFIG